MIWCWCKFFGKLVLFQGMCMEFRDKIMLKCSLEMSCRLLTAKSWSTPASPHQPAFMGNCMTISQRCLPCPPSRWVSLCVLCPRMIGLMVVLLTIFWDGECVFSTIWVGVILGNGCETHGQNYVPLFQGSKATVQFHYSNWVVCIKCYRLFIRNTMV